MSVFQTSLWVGVGIGSALGAATGCIGGWYTWFTAKRMDIRLIVLWTLGGGLAGAVVGGVLGGVVGLVLKCTRGDTKAD